MDTHHHRIVVVGCSCCGKTSYSRRLAAALRQPHVELDILHWKPDWIPRPTTEFRSLVANSISTPRWIVDGNYQIVRDLIYPKASCVVWLNFSFATVLVRSVCRMIKHPSHREDPVAESKESLRKALLNRYLILFWVVITYRRRRSACLKLRKASLYPHLTWFEFRTQSEADDFLSLITLLK